jgi:hypothetical protein
MDDVVVEYGFHKKGAEAMAKIAQPFLFNWDQVDEASDLDRLDLVLETIPDRGIIRELKIRRGNGRNTYPVVPMWNAVIAGIVFQHPTPAALLRELRRNGELRQRCGFDPLQGAAAVPSAHNMSRFLRHLIALEPMLQAMFDQLVDQATELVPDLGQELAFDGKAIPSYSTGKKKRDTGQSSDPDADHGVKTYRGVGQDGHLWEKVKRWFGYQLHLIVDAHHELPVGYEVMQASTSEVTRLVPMVERLEEKHPELLARTETLAADKGLDSGPVNRTLLQDYAMRPIIDTRTLWSQEKDEPGYDPDQPITRPLDPERVDTIVYTERGDVRCICPQSGEERELAFMGYEKDREGLKYRCPAAAYGFDCAGRAECEALASGTPGRFGRIVRVPLQLDYRIFVPTPRSSPSFQRAYARRSSVERVNSRIDHVLGFEHHTIRGLQKMRTRMGLALVVMLAMAVGRIQAGRKDRMRSFVGAIRHGGPGQRKAA